MPGLFLKACGSWAWPFLHRWVIRRVKDMSFDKDVAVANLLRYFRDSLIGRNAKGIVHNMNSPLQVLSMHMELLAMDLGHLVGLKCDNSQITSGISQAANRLEQLEDIVSRINDMVKLVGSRVYDEEQQEEEGPVMVTQLLSETIEFWKSDLFFKHKVGLDLSFPETSPVLILNEQHVKDSFDGILFSTIELLRETPEPVLEIALSTSDENLVSVGFYPKGISYPVEELEKISSISNENELAKELVSLTLKPLLLAMAVAKTSLKKAGSDMEIARDGVVVKLRNAS